MLLSAFHKYEKLIDRVRFVWYSYWAFRILYTDYRDFEVENLVENLKLDTGARVSYPILNVKVKLTDGRIVEMKVSTRRQSSACLKRW